MKRLVLLTFIVLMTGTGCSAARNEAGTPSPWRCGWVGLKDAERTIAGARELGFCALVASGKGAPLEAFAQKAREAGIECYAWFSLAPEKGEQAMCQVMSAEEQAARERLAADKDPRKHGYQFGGEPVYCWRRSAADQPAPALEVFETPLLCFHRDDVRALARQRIARTLAECPALSGIALDYIGYQNYRCCRCDVSNAQLAEWSRAHPDLKGEAARDGFSLETLVAFNNELADYIRSLRADLKVTAHIYPVFLPEPLYGNRLNLDTCQQTTAWFFEPYWPDEKVRRHAAAIVREGARYHARARGIPFMGLYVRRPSADKPVERFARELDLIFEASGGTDFAVYNFGDLVQHEEYRKAFLDALARHAR